MGKDAVKQEQPLTRLSDWPSRLQAFLLDHQHQPFHYGQWDCFLFVCNAISAMTSLDLAAPFRGTYSSRAECRRAMIAYCGSASIQAVAESLFSTDHGMLEITPLHAQRGDVVLIKRSRDFSLGLVAMNGRDIAIVASRRICLLPLSAAVRAWRV